VIRSWEVNTPAEVEEPIEWILITSVPTRTVDEAKGHVRWYTYRWLTEDYHLDCSTPTLSYLRL
jgi:hypothetical protein